MNLTFWGKNILHIVVPGGIGYSRELKKHQDAQYDHHKHKAKVRHKHDGASGWKNESDEDGLKHRDYTSYEEYVDHQKEKFSEIIKISGGFDKKTILKYRLQFFDRFKDLHNYLPMNAKAICLGARQGTEVEVLRDLGFENAMGIDLNPGPNNPLVVPGDFMNLKEGDGSIDFLYTNAVDHAFDLHKLFKEHARVLKKGGYVLYDIALQDGGAFEAVHWNKDADILKIMLQYFNEVESIKVDKQRRWKSVLLKK